jgi:hypothetical protein
MPEIPAPTDHTRPKSQLPVGLLLRGGSTCDGLYLNSRVFLGGRPGEIVNDFPGGEWRRVERSEGYRAIVVNGEMTS